MIEAKLLALQLATQTIAVECFLYMCDAVIEYYLCLGGSVELV